jgi:hypothetical protein
MLLVSGCEHPNHRDDEQSEVVERFGVKVSEKVGDHAARLSSGFHDTVMIFIPRIAPKNATADFFQSRLSGSSAPSLRLI